MNRRGNVIELPVARGPQPQEPAHWILRVMDRLDGDAGDRFVALVCAFSAGAVCALAVTGQL